MNYNFSETTYPSKDGIHTIYAEIYTPKHSEPKGIIQVAHGMIDYIGRYHRLAEFITGEGYILAGNHHLGHGKSVNSEDDYGFFADESGVDFLVRDMHTMNKYLRDKFPSIPLYVLGHSMGSFIARLYAAEHPHTLKGLIIHGTGGANPLASLGIAVAKTSRLLHGPRHRSELIRKMTFGSYNKRFPKSEGENAWLTRDVARVAGRAEDKYTSFTFTTQGYIDLFTMVKRSNSKEWYSAYPKGLPTLIISGAEDPVGDYGKGPDQVYKKLMLEGCTTVTLKMYEGARHELFNETNRHQVFEYLAAWLGGALK